MIYWITFLYLGTQGEEGRTEGRTEESGDGIIWGAKEKEEGKEGEEEGKICVKSFK